MANDFYTASGNPAPSSPGASATMRAEFLLIQAGFDLISVPALPAPAGRALIVNDFGTGFTTTAGRFAIAGNLTTTGAFNTTLVQVASVSLTLPAGNGTLARTSDVPSAAAAADIWVGTDSAKYLTVASLYTSSAPVVVTFAASLTLDLSTFLNPQITLTGNLTLNNPTISSAIVGKRGTIRLVQGGSGSYTLTLGNQGKVVGGAPTLSTSVGAVDHLNYWCVSTGLIECSFGKGLT